MNNNKPTLLFDRYSVSDYINYKINQQSIRRTINNYSHEKLLNLDVEKNSAELIKSLKLNAPVLDKNKIGISKRIGVESAGQDALLPYRFYIRGNKYVSGKNK